MLIAALRANFTVVFSGGRTNHLFTCGSSDPAIKPKKVFLRMYGGSSVICGFAAIALLTFTGDSSDMLPHYLDVAVSCILERIGLGTEVFGVFETGLQAKEADWRILDFGICMQGDWRVGLTAALFRSMTNE